ncbi:GMC family oxidoreductase [Acinetobacter sp. MB5]|uniref:GMC family oxidoreductase n=1 Tax=Acinetobacter sp. MB5 TaxID=2069438 RepID=UPI000DD0B250|nr:GMC family oxidoreductase N-terminal domain-containing protein [Acinetobacter sp. MB5]
MLKPSYDYIVIGAGTAGCVVATRLLEAGAGTVLLLEAGDKDNSIFHKIPATVVKVFQQKSWPYMTVPQPHCNDREMILAQGKVMGGGSSVNGMIYTRGQPEDYDRWAQDWGCAGWAYEDVLPYFVRAENNESLSDAYHGQGGHLSVSENRYRHPLTQAFVRAGQQMGLNYVNDFNGKSQVGIGFYQTTTKNGERASTSQTYLKSIADNPNLTVVTHALVHKIEIQNSVAEAVSFSVADQAVQTIRANKEVVVCAGAIGSPKVLMLSGIGPKAQLETHQIPCVLDLPVGENFHDHLHVSINATIKEPTSIIEEDKGLKSIKHGLQWLFTRSGLLTSNILEGAGFVDSQNQGSADVQFMFLPVLDNFDNTPGEKAATFEHGITIKTCHLQPKARGRITLRSRNPKDFPILDPNYLGDQQDIDGQIRGVQAGLKMLQQPALKDLIQDVIEPANIAIEDTEGLHRWLKQNIKTVYHPVGTCRMGASPEDSVTDLNLKVHGMQNLRVIDCSICPQVPSANTNAVAVMIGERGADFILSAQKQPIKLKQSEPVLA